MINVLHSTFIINLLSKITFFHCNNPFSETHSLNSLSFDLYQTHTLPSSCIFTSFLVLTTLGPPGDHSTPTSLTVLFAFFILPLSLLSCPGVFVSVVLLSHFHPEPSEAWHERPDGGVSCWEESRKRKEVESREGRKRRRADRGRQTDGGNSWTSSSVVLIRELRCCETTPWGWL